MDEYNIVCQHKIKDYYCIKCDRLVFMNNISIVPKNYKSEVFLPIKDFIDHNNIYKKTEINIFHQYLRNRKLILKSIKCVFRKYNLNESTYFYCINLLDLIFNNNIEISQYEDIILGAVILSIKFNEIQINYAKSDNIIESLNNLIRKNNNIEKSEIVCLKLIGYRLNTTSFYNILRFFLTNGILFSNDPDYQLCSRVYLFALEIADLVLENIDYLKYRPLYISTSIVTMAREIIMLKYTWNDVLKNVYNINYEDFEEEYEFVKRIYNTEKKINKARSSDKLKNFGEEFKISDKLNRNFTYHKPKHNFISTKMNTSEITCSKEVYCKKVIKNKNIENINQEIKANKSAIFNDKNF